MITHHIDMNPSQLASPAFDKIKHWAELALEELTTPHSLCITLASKDEIHQLNLTYRNKDKPTNILSFPDEQPDYLKESINPLGDLVVCPAILEEEAIEQGKPLEDHWAHMIVHGVLHLLGHEHEESNEALIMESKEILLLSSIGIKNPYNEI